MAPTAALLWRAAAALAVVARTSPLVRAYAPQISLVAGAPIRLRSKADAGPTIGSHRTSDAGGGVDVLFRPRWNAPSTTARRPSVFLCARPPREDREGAPPGGDDDAVPPAGGSILEDALLELELDEVEVELGMQDETESSAASESSRPMRPADASAIIAGCAVGGGFLALPSLTSPVGYPPTVLGLTLAWALLTLWAISFAEAAGLVDDDRAWERERAAAADGEEGEGGSGEDLATTKGGGSGEGLSVASVIHHAFGRRWAVLGGLAFLAQMLAIMTAQVVKGAEIISREFGVPYKVACVVPAALVGTFAFCSRQEAVEGANTALTAMMVGGFAALVASAIDAGARAGWDSVAAALFGNSRWSRLLPGTKGTWAMPIFVKLLAFGEAMPLIVERMVKGHDSKTASESSSGTRGDDRKDGNEDASGTDARTAAFRRVRSATVLGSSVPLVLAVIWAGISASLVDPASPEDPIVSLLSHGPRVSVPVSLLSYGAIGTTLLSSFLAMGHFAADVVRSKLGRRSIGGTRVADFLTVALPCALACVGPALYMPLLAFAGAYPTTILYGFAPALAAIKLRRKARGRPTASRGAVPATPRLVPGGEPTLIALATAAVGLVGTSTVLACRHLLLAVR